MLGYQSGDKYLELEQRFDELDEQDFIRIAEDAESDTSRDIYLVRGKGGVLNFPKVYENNRYVIFRVE